MIYGFAASALSEARTDALHRALETYSLHTLRRTRRPANQVRVEAGDNGRPPPSLVFEELTTWLGTRGRSSNDECDAVRASTLDGSKVYRVPLSAVMACPAVNGLAEFEPCADGVAAGRRGAEGGGLTSTSRSSTSGAAVCCAAAGTNESGSKTEVSAVDANQQSRRVPRQGV